MLEELNIRDFAIIDQLNVRFGPGFNVLTGETGAGKSIIIDAVGALLGGKVGSDMIRTGASSARVEGIFSLNPEDFADGSPLTQLLEDYGLRDSADPLAGDEPLILTREVNMSGRSTSRVNGRAVPVGVLAQIGSSLVDIHGQSEHLSLLKVSRHLDLLDRYAGTVGLRDAVSGFVGQLRAILREQEDLLTGQRDAARRLDLLRYQVEEISSAALHEGEEEELTAERQVLSNAERLAEMATLAGAMLSEGDGEAPGALTLIGRASQTLSDLIRLDPTQAELGDSLKEALYTLDDVARSLHRYGATVEYNPERLAEVEERLALIASLKRKYGSSIAEIIAFGQEASNEQETLVHSDERLIELADQAQKLRQEIGRLAADLSHRRQASATQLGTAVEGQLADLNMSRARFVVDVRQTPDPAGVPVPAALSGRASNGTGEQSDRTFAFDERGIDRVEFLISPNPGEELRPLARIASGGEMARLMLALKTILSTADHTGTLIFDEVDTGVGGRSGSVVGEKLRYLANDHQVLCVTHLPQVAALGSEHFRIIKQVRDNRTRTEVLSLSDAERVDELAQMLGGTSAGAAARQAARELMAHAAG